MDIPTKVYHYTDLDGAISIIKNKEMRLTQLDYLNDLTETEIFYNRCVKIIGRENFTSDIDDHEVLKKYLKGQTTNSKFSISFCEKKDSIPMWNSYGSKGVCLEFDISNCKSKDLKVDKVNYLKDSQITDLVGTTIEFVKVDGGFKNKQSMYVEVLSKLLKESVFYKLDSFKYEEEVRLVLSAYKQEPIGTGKIVKTDLEPNLNLYHNGNMMKLYTTRSFRTLGIKLTGVYISDHLDKRDATIISALNFLIYNHYSDESNNDISTQSIPVSALTIPLR